MSEMISRTAKNIFFEEIAYDDQQETLNFVIIQFLNLMFGNSEESSSFLEKVYLRASDYFRINILEF